MTRRPPAGRHGPRPDLRRAERRDPTSAERGNAASDRTSDKTRSASQPRRGPVRRCPDPGTRGRSDVHSRLAAAAIALIGPGETLGLDNSSATTRIVEQLCAALPTEHLVTVVTNSLRQAEVLAAAGRRHHVRNDAAGPRAPKLVLLGGTLDGRGVAFHGPDTAPQLQHLCLDVAVLTVTAVRADALGVADQTAAATATSLLRAATRRIFLLDASQLFASAGTHDVIRRSELAAADCVVVIGTLTEEDRLALAAFTDDCSARVVVR